MISFVGLQGQLFLRLHFLSLHLFDLKNNRKRRGRNSSYLGRENGFWLGSGVDARGLDRDDKVTLRFQKVVGIESHDSGLIGLGNVSENTVNHADEHSVFVGVSGILDDGDDVGSLLRDVEKISAGSVGEFNGVDETFWSDDVRDVGNSGSRGSTKIKHLRRH